VDEKPSSGWKWIAGCLALVVSYQMGYESGLERSVASTAPVASTGYPSTADPDDVSIGNVGAPETSSAVEDATTNVSGDVSTPDATTTAEPEPTEKPGIGPDTTTGRPWDDDPIVAGDEDDADGVENELSGDPTPLASSIDTNSSSTRLNTYAAAKSASYGCAENGSCYGDISAATGRAKTVSVRGYYRRDGTYVRGYYRSRPN
jgi:hypothetical protein